MKPFTLCLLAISFLCSTAPAQQDMRSRLRLKSPVKDAGIYHCALGTWTRPGAIASQSLLLGPTWSTIYNNSCSSPYFTAASPGEYCTDEGRLPSKNSPDKIFSQAQASSGLGAAGECPLGPSSAPGSAAGSANSYKIGAFQIGYCSQAIGATTSIQFEFRNSAHASLLGCAESRATAPAPVASFTISGLPGNSGGPMGCWTVTLDLTGTSASFAMLADGTGDYDNPTNSSDLEHLFSWTFRMPNAIAPTSTSASGWFVAGNPANRTGGPNQPLGPPNSNGWTRGPALSGTLDSFAGYDGTVWDKHGAYPPPSLFNGGSNGSIGPLGLIASTYELGTGMSSKDCLRFDKGTTTSAGSFGGPAAPATNPFASLFLRLFTTDNTSFVSAPGTGFCYGDGCAFTCPCTAGTIPNPQGQHETGCANGPSFGSNIGSMLTTSGSSTPLAGESVSLHCRIDFLSPFAKPLAIGVKGSARLENGLFPATSDGVRCIDGTLISFGAHLAGTNGNGLGTWSYPTTVGSETIPVSIATGAANGQLAWFQVFHRNSPNAFCFSDKLVGTNWSNGMIIKWGAP